MSINLSIIIPTYCEAQGLAESLQRLQALRQQGAEIIVADGGSDDGTVEIAQQWVDKVVVSDKGRAQQMNSGAEVATADCLMFLHADTALPVTAADSLRVALASGRRWGFFRVRLSGSHPLLRCVERGINIRSRLTGVATGDQAIFISRTTWDAVGGYASIALMEDVELSKRLRRVSMPFVVADPLVTSSRRWEKRGVLRTILLMWWLRLAYVLGVAPSRLAQWYR